MTPVWVAFLAGIFVGSGVGVFVVALCVAAKRGDELPLPCHCDHTDQGRACRTCGGK